MKETLPDVCDNARLLLVEVREIKILQLLQVVSPDDAEESPDPMDDIT
jgi:hypothetical protein